MIRALLRCSIYYYLMVTTAANAFQPSMIRDVMVIGGTHGNEYTGVWCIKAMEKQRASWESRYTSLQLHTILGNPQAHLENKRFVDADLNREFSLEKLRGMANDHKIDSSEVRTNGDLSSFVATVESQRARELDRILGSKTDGASKIDVAIDLHSTTTNMGVTIIVAEGDELMAQAAAYVSMKRPGTRCLMHSIPNRMDRPNVSSAAKHGITIEVGPVPVGVLRHDAVENTETALHAVLEFLHRRNQDKDKVCQELQEAFSNGVPCFRTAPAVSPGEMSGKIRWPSDPDNPNFPALMVHKSVQDRDYHRIKTGQPLFVALDGSVVNYEGSHGKEVYLIFVNEAGYYFQSSGTGIGVAVEAKFGLDGMLIQEEEAPFSTFE